MLYLYIYIYILHVVRRETALHFPQGITTMKLGEGRTSFFRSNVPIRMSWCQLGKKKHTQMLTASSFFLGVQQGLTPPSMLFMGDPAANESPTISRWAVAVQPNMDLSLVGLNWYDCQFLSCDTNPPIRSAAWQNHQLAARDPSHRVRSSIFSETRFIQKEAARFWKPATHH